MPLKCVPLKLLLNLTMRREYLQKHLIDTILLKNLAPFSRSKACFLQLK